MKTFSNIGAKIQSLLKIKNDQSAQQIFFVSGNLINFLFGGGFWIIASRFFSVELIGFSGNAITAAIFFGSMSLFGINLTIMRKYANDKTQLSDAIFTIIVLQLAITLIVSNVYLTILFNFNKILFEFLLSTTFNILSFYLIIYSWGLIYIQESIFILHKKPFKVFLRNMIEGVIKFSLVLLFAFYRKLDDSILLSWGIAMFFSVLIVSLKYLKHIKIKFLSFKEILNMYKLSALYFIVYQLLGSTSFILTSYIITYYGAEINGIFYIGWTMATIIFIIPRSTSLYIMPDFLTSSNSDKKIKDTLKLSFLLESIIFIVFLFAGKYIFQVFGKIYSQNSFYLFLILMTGVVPLTIFNIIIEYIRALDEFKRLVFISIAQVFFLILFLLLDIFIFSIYYVCSVYPITLFVLSVILLIDKKLFLDKKIKNRHMKIR